MSYLDSPMHSTVGQLADALVKKDADEKGNFICSKCGCFIYKYHVQWHIDDKTWECSGPLCGDCVKRTTTICPPVR